MYIGVENKARSLAGGYFGVNGKAREIVKGYIGDANGKARLFYNAKRPATCTIWYYMGTDNLEVEITFIIGDTWSDLEDDNITIDSESDAVFYMNQLLLKGYDTGSAGVKGSDKIIEDCVYYTATI